MAASHHGDTPYSGNSVTSVPITPYTTSVDVNRARRDLADTAGGTGRGRALIIPSESLQEQFADRRITGPAVRGCQ